MGISLFYDIITIITISILSVFICNKIKIPPIVGFLIAGIIAGPSGFKLISSVQGIEIFGEIGIIFLLFTIGIEFSLSKLIEIKKTVLLGGSIQLLLTIILIFFLSLLFGLEYNSAIFMGFLVAVTSTAIILNILQSKSLVNSPVGRISIGISLFQDISTVLMILLIPILAGKSENPLESFLILIPKYIFIIAFTFVSAKWIIPKIFFQVSKTRIRELFILLVIFICLVIVYGTYWLGLSLSLGAFLAGLIIPESDYSYEALGNVLPFKDLFTSFFFVSIGIMLDLNFVFHNINIILFLFFIILVIKFGTGFIATISLRYPLRIAIIVGFTLFPIGEFSFILAKSGIELNFLSNYYYQLFLSLAVFSLATTPFLFDLSPIIAKKATKLLKSKRKTAKQIEEDFDEFSELNDHIIIIGYGINGRNISRAANYVNIPYIILEMNPITVKSEKQKGERIIYGDATNYTVLEHAHIHSARIAVIAISDPVSTRSITKTIKRINPDLYLIVRTRFFQEMQELYKLGADDVIPEEFETSIEIFTRVLTKYFVSDDEIEKLTSEIRSEGYKMFRSISERNFKYDALKFHIPDFDIHTIKISKSSLMVNFTLAELKLPEKHKLTILAIKRGDEIFVPPPADIKIIKDDILVIFGSRDDFIGYTKIFK